MVCKEYLQSGNCVCEIWCVLAQIGKAPEDRGYSNLEFQWQRILFAATVVQLPHLIKILLVAG